MITKQIIPFLLLAFLISCGSNADNNQTQVELKTEKDKLSYVLGSMSALNFTRGDDPNLKRLDYEQMIEGFKENLNDNNPVECDEQLKKLFGPNGQDLDDKFLKSGSKCLGKISGYSFFNDLKKRDGLKYINLDMAIAGFRDGLNKRDTLVPDELKQKILLDFIKQLNENSGEKMLAAAKRIKGATVFQNGIVMQVVKEGTGGYPGSKDDVKVEYILTSAIGDTVQSSYDMKKQTGKNEPVALKLNGGVIPGWTFVIPKMKKGGKYRVYIPWKLAYGEEGGRESLCFLIDLLDYAKEGTFVKPQPPSTGMPQNQ